MSAHAESRPLQADHAQIDCFVNVLFRYADEGTYVSLRAFDQIDAKRPPFLTEAVQINGSLSPLIAASAKAAQRCADHHRPIVFAPPIATFSNPDRARGADLANGLVLSVEIDDSDPDDARTKLEQILGPVTMAVESGSFWTDPETGECKPKLHLHWRLSEPTLIAEDHELLRQARKIAALLVGADPTGNPIVHPLRWPGSWNCKAAPRLARIASFNEAAEIHLNDALEWLTEAAGLQQAGIQRGPSGPPEAPVELVRNAMQAIPNPGIDVHYDEWIRLGYAAYRATGGSEDGFAIWDEWSRKSEKYNATETKAAWLRIKSAVEGSAVSRTIGAGTIFFHAGNAGWQRPNCDNTDEESNQAEREQQNSGASATEPALLDPWDALQPPTFPIDALPAVLRTFVEDRAQIIGADPCALAWAAISAASTALDGRIRLQMKQRDTWTVPPFIWLALIGAPSTKKTPILDAAWEPLLRAQSADLQAWQIEHAGWSALSKKERAETPEPHPRRRLVSHDATIESIQDILGRQDRGLGILRDELAGWVGSLEKYSSGRGSAADRAFFLQAFNGGHYVVDRISRGTVAIDNLGLTVAGGIQPDRLHQLGDLTSDGLWQRLAPIIVAPASLGSDGAATSAVGDYAAMVERLLQVPHTTRVALSEAAQEVRNDIAARIFEIEQSEALGPAFSAFCGKMHGFWGRLCLVLSQIDPEPVPFVVPERIAIAATTLLFNSVLPNAARVYSSMGGAGGNMDATRSVAGFILTKSKSRILASDLTRHVRACRGQPLENVQRMISPLVAGGWLAPEQVFNPTAWAVHPFVHQRFATRAAQEAARRGVIRTLIMGTTENEEAA